MRKPLHDVMLPLIRRSDKTRLVLLASIAEYLKNCPAVTVSEGLILKRLLSGISEHTSSDKITLDCETVSQVIDDLITIQTVETI